jgi:hypothetical protein
VSVEGIDWDRYMKILDRLPISELGWVVSTPDSEEVVKPYQIIIQVSITGRKVSELPEDAPRMPAVLDTGNNHNFAIRRRHLERWTSPDLPGTGWIEVGGFLVPLLAASIWIHPNQAGSVEPNGQAPFVLAIKEGIAVYPPDIPNPARLPILGLRALIRNGLKLTMDGATSELTLESPSPPG